jgi:hypothetical protein
MFGAGGGVRTGACALICALACAVDERAPTTVVVPAEAPPSSEPGERDAGVLVATPSASGVDASRATSSEAPPPSPAPVPSQSRDAGALRADALVPADAAPAPVNPPVLPPPRLASFDLTVGTQSYSHSCSGGSSILGDIGVGPTIDTVYAHDNGNDCAWPEDGSRMTLEVQFAGFLQSQARLLAGEFDLADPASADSVRIELIVSPPTPEVPVGMPSVMSYAEYMSYVEDVSTRAISRVANSSGRVVSVLDETGTYRVELTEVTLPLSVAVGPADAAAVATVHHAVLYY